LTAPGTTRRGFLSHSAAAAVATWLGPAADALGRDETLLGTVPFVGEGAFPVAKTVGAGLGRRRALDLSTLSHETLLTPQDRFFIRTGCPDALPPASSWRVRVRGLVDAPAEIALAELQREEGPMGAHLLECAGNSRAAHFGFMSVASWTGVPFERLLKRARPHPAATQVLVSGFDDHPTRDPGSVPGASWIFRLEQVRAAGAFLATRMNGASLSPDHGYPVRLVVPGWYGCAAIKWVNEIALVDDEAVATDHMQEYAGRTHQDPAGYRLARDFRPATIDPAAVPVRVEKIGGAGGTISYRIVGILWGGRTAAHALRIRLDPRAGFSRVKGMRSDAGSPWTLWSHTFQPPAPGRYRIELAVTDPAVRTRRLATGFYAREIQIDA
jgi:DMSO/TMAO reductase YedYZ molybdopterin-dependent catalytic subunit